MEHNKDPQIPHQWRFQRFGGSNQVQLNTGDDIKALSTLNPKLWMALSCPVAGLEFDQNLLKLLDMNGDHRIRIAEVLAAIDWLKPRLNDFSSLIEHPEWIDLTNLCTDTAEGQRLLSTANAILANLNNVEQQKITLTEIQESSAINAKKLYNGDGIFSASPELPEPMQHFIQLAIAIAGSVPDANTEKGINLEIATEFVNYIQRYNDWHHNFKALQTDFGDDTAPIWTLIQVLKPKIDDYFLRTNLASYAPQAQESLNVDQKYIVPMDNGILDDTQLSELPLSKIEANAPLPLQSGLNPIWQARIEQFAHYCHAFISDPAVLTHKEWREIQTKLSSYQSLITEKPVLTIKTLEAPTMTVEELTPEQIELILTPNLLSELKAMVAQDLDTPISAQNLLELEHLATYHLSLYRFLNNFVSFNDFFSLSRKAAFQSGELYLDGRCCTFCCEVTDIAKHSVLATYSALYLIYCHCTRKKPTGDPELDNKTIVAAMTAGDGLFLVEGRNGLYLDHSNQDWDATIVKIIKNPISIRQAILEPYRRIGYFITEQINKWATNKDSAMMENTTQKITEASTTTATTPEANKFDIAKSAGIFAAIGLALGALGTAIASIASSLFALHWWQIPFVFLGIFIIISGPSVILAWIKLYGRKLAPFLEASGWATNSNTKINFYLGNKLTSRAQLPPNAKLNLTDPTKKSKTAFWIWLFIIIVICVGIGYGYWKYQYSAETTDVITQQTVTEMEQVGSEPAVTTESETTTNTETTVEPEEATETNQTEAIAP